MHTESTHHPVPANATGVHRYRQPITGAINLFAGAVGGGFSVILCQPLDTIKVKMQTYPAFYKGAWDCAKKTWNRQGIKGLYAGTVPSLTANVLENASLFMFYGFCQRGVQVFDTASENANESTFSFQHLFNVRKAEDLSTFQNACAGGGAAFFTSFFLCPTELLKCQLQAMDEHRQMQLAADPKAKVDPKIGPWRLMRNILHKEGVRGMFSGFSSTLVREIPGYFLFFGGYDLAKKVLAEPGQSKEDLGSAKIIACGAFAGVTCWAGVFPADVVKSRIQTGRAPPGFLKCLVTVGKTEGILALYNGLGPTLLRTMPASGSLFLAYEFTKSTLERMIFGDNQIS